MTDSLNVNDNLYKGSTPAKEFNKDPTDEVVPVYEEITVTKTEVKEELYDFEMSLDEMECTNAKEERNFSPVIIFDEENLELITNPKQSSNENLVSANCHLRGEDLQKKQKLPKKHFKRKEQAKITLKIHPLRKGDGELKKCTYCKYVTHNKTDLMRHIRTHTNDRPFKCTYKNCECTAGQEESCNCDMCEYAATQDVHLKCHILVKHSGKPKNYKCSHCKYTSHRKYELTQHIRTHTNDRPFKCTYKNCECMAEQEELCKCDRCGYAAARKDNLKTHIMLKHSGEPKKYKCADCKYTSHEKVKLKRHICIHANDRPFKCSYKNCECTAGQEESCKCDRCGYATTHKDNLRRHILVKHSGKPKKYNCADCKYSTHQKGKLERHIRIHANDRPFKCTYKNCSCTPTRQELCKCDMCGFAAAEKSNLKVHILRKHSGKPKKYKCADCKYTAHLKFELDRHIRIHTNDTASKCTYKYL